MLVIGRYTHPRTPGTGQGIVGDKSSTMIIGRRTRGCHLKPYGVWEVDHMRGTVLAGCESETLWTRKDVTLGHQVRVFTGKGE